MIYRERAWWDSSGLPRLGYIVPRLNRAELLVHHTVTIDPDPSPLVWETDQEIKDHMLRLQTIRPDLDLDIPYNFVAFITPTGLVICEGRGIDRTGAHTHGHNTVGLATSFAGNFEAYGIPAGWVVPELNQWFRYLKILCVNLGPIYGHRDFAQTACPGNNLYVTKPFWSWAPVEEDDMATLDADDLQKIEDLFIRVLRSEASGEFDVGGMRKDVKAIKAAPPGGISVAQLEASLAKKTWR